MPFRQSVKERVPPHPPPHAHQPLLPCLEPVKAAAKRGQNGRGMDTKLQTGETSGGPWGFMKTEGDQLAGSGGAGGEGSRPQD